MGKLSRIRQEEKDKIEDKISRRKFLNRFGLGLTGIILASMSKTIFDSLKSPTYLEAYEDPNLRADWLNSLESRTYAEKKIMDESDIPFLKERGEYPIPFGSYASTIPLDKDNIGHGTKSRLYIYPESFDKSPKMYPLRNSLAPIIENVVNNHELIHADHFYSGMIEFPESTFFENGKFKSEKEKGMFIAISELICNRREYDALDKLAQKDDFINEYREILRQSLIPVFFHSLRSFTQNPEILNKASTFL